MADVTINLIHKSDGLYYAVFPSDHYFKLEEDSTVEIDIGQSIAWKCADDSIEKIKQIEVNKQKTEGKNWKDFWSEKPQKSDRSGRTFEGVVKSDPVDPSNPQFNGYDITYKTPEGKVIIVDPDLKLPPG